MKTLQALYNEMISCEELKKEYITAVRGGNAPGFFRAHGVETTEDEMQTFFE